MALIKADGYQYIGKHSLVIPHKFRWPKEPYVFFDLTGSGVILEKDVGFTSGVRVYTHTHQFEKASWRKLPVIYSKKDTIFKKFCFVGANVIILSTCKYIGICSVIGAGAVVTKDIPDYEIWVGNPAKKIGDVEH